MARRLDNRSKRWPGYDKSQGTVLTIVKRSLTAYGAKDDMGAGGSMTENVIADLQEAGYSIVEPQRQHRHERNLTCTTSS